MVLQVRVHILIHRQEGERDTGNGKSFETSKATTNDTPLSTMSYLLFLPK